MNKNILIIGSTGKLGSSLLKYCYTNNLKISCITCFKNKNKLLNQKNKNLIDKYFCLGDKLDQLLFIKYLNKTKFKIVYFLDYGYQSLKYLELILINNKYCSLAIANKELLIAGGQTLTKKIFLTKNNLIPLDSEHFSLLRSNISNNNIKKVFITASGGPFYFNKKIELNNVGIKQVLKHPKWKMGINNTIDSSNFINKILEIYELSTIFNITLDRISFLVSKEAYVHSVVLYLDNTVVVNCFENNMLLTLIKPLTKIFQSNQLVIKSDKFLNNINLKIEKFSDNRFKISKYINKLMKLNHHQQIKFMILNNIAHKKYLDGNLNYNDIIDFIMKNLYLNDLNLKLNSFKNILIYAESIKSKYEF